MKMNSLTAYSTVELMNQAIHKANLHALPFKIRKAEYHDGTFFRPVFQVHGQKQVEACEKFNFEALLISMSCQMCGLQAYHDICHRCGCRHCNRCAIPEAEDQPRQCPVCS